MKLYKLRVLLCLLSLVVICTSANATSVSSIDFSGGAGGTLNFTPPSISSTGTPFTLTNVPISKVFQTPANSPSFFVTGGLLQVTSGAVTSTSSTPPSTLNYTATFGAGGSFDITGEVCTVNLATCPIADVVVPTGSLLSGSFLNGGTFTRNKTSGTYTGFLEVPLGGINSTLEAALGFPSGTFETAGKSGVDTETLIKVQLSSLGTFTGKAGGSNVVVTPAPVPEPASLALFGTGLIAAAGVFLRKIRAQTA